MYLPGTYANGFAPRDGAPRYPQLWEGVIASLNPGLGPTGMALFDWSGYGNQCDLIGMQSASDWVQSEGKYALDFDGIDDCAITTIRPIVLKNLTMSAWFKTTTTTSGRYIMSIGNNATINQFSGLRTASSNRMEFTLRDDANVALTVITMSGLVVNDGKWHHIAGVRTDDTYEIFIDGNIARTSVSSGPTTSTLNRMSLGCLTRTTNSNFIEGTIDDARIFRRSLNASEIALLASRRGISYELAPRPRPGTPEAIAAAFKAYWAQRRSQMIGLGL